MSGRGDPNPPWLDVGTAAGLTALPYCTEQSLPADMASMLSIALRSTKETVDMPYFEPGDILADEYRVERTLGQGGMATVYLCRDMELERQVVSLATLQTGNPQESEQDT